MGRRARQHCRGLIEYGLLHERCARLALCSCPALLRWKKALVLLNESDIERGEWDPWSSLLKANGSAHVDVENYRSLHPRDPEGDD